MASVEKTTGAMSALKIGTAKITVTTYNGKKAYATVQVCKAPDAIYFEQNSLTLKKGQKYSLLSHVKSGSASRVRKFTSSDSRVIKTSGSNITALNYGTATVKVTTYNGKSTSCTITVRSVPSFKKYFNKNFSIMGDSISTLQGYNPKGYNVFYNAKNGNATGVLKYGDTWWGQVINDLGGNLFINASYSGSCVSKVKSNKSLFPSASSNQRVSALRNYYKSPDVIIVCMGINDWLYCMPIKSSEPANKNSIYEYFGTAYSSMIDKIKADNPKAEIWCCTVDSTYKKADSSFKFSLLDKKGYSLKDYNDVIRSTCKDKKCKLIDLYAQKVPYNSLDGIHPMNDGMKTLSTLVKKIVTSK